MKRPGYLLCILLLLVSELVFSQSSGDSSFFLLFNSSLDFTHANDPHINRWLEKYGYPAEPHVPASLNFEIAAVPAASRLLYSIRLATVYSGNNLSSFNVLAGLYTTLVKKKRLQLWVGSGAGYHANIIMLNGSMPAEYAVLAAQVHGPLALRRTGLIIEPALRAFWFPVRFHNVQVGISGGLGYDLDFNSRWRLGYYDNNHGEYNRFRKLQKPGDQLRVSEYGLSYNAGISLRVNLH